MKDYKNIVLYGVNARCLHWQNEIERKYPQKRLHWADTNQRAIQKYIQVYSMDDVVDFEECTDLIGITNRAAAEEVKKAMLQKGIEENQIYLL